MTAGHGHISLDELVQLLGPRIWGKEWTGRELWARPLRPPDEETKDIEAMRREAAKLERKLRSAAKVLDDAGIAHDKLSLHPRNRLARLSELVPNSPAGPRLMIGTKPSMRPTNDSWKSRSGFSVVWRRARSSPRSSATT
jgi:hypothetical protein